MVKYKIVRNANLYDLEEEVNKLLEEGWYPIGPVVIDNMQFKEIWEHYYVQTLILEK